MSDLVDETAVWCSTNELEIKINKIFIASCLLYVMSAICTINLLCVVFCFVCFVYEIELLFLSKYHTVLRVCKHAFPISVVKVCRYLCVDTIIAM